MSEFAQRSKQLFLSSALDKPRDPLANSQKPKAGRDVYHLRFDTEIIVIQEHKSSHMLKKIIRLITFYTQSNNKEIIKLLFEPKWKFYLYLD